MTATLVERASSFLESKLSRRSFINRSAYAGSAVAVGAGLDLVLKPALQATHLGQAGWWIP